MKDRKDSKKAPRNDVTIRERLLEEFGLIGKDIPTREMTVMTRLGREIVEKLDALVKLNLFKSRSEVVAAIVENKILSNLELFNTIQKQAEKIDKLHDELENLTLQALRE